MRPIPSPSSRSAPHLQRHHRRLRRITLSVLGCALLLFPHGARADDKKLDYELAANHLAPSLLIQAGTIPGHDKRELPQSPHDLILILKNVTRSPLPSWASAGHDAVTIALYRHDPHAREVLLSKADQPLVHVITDLSRVHIGPAKTPASPTAPIAPGECLTAYVNLILGPGSSTPDSFPVATAGEYQLVFTLASTGRVLLKRNFEVAGSEAQNLRFAHLPLTPMLPWKKAD